MAKKDEIQFDNYVDRIKENYLLLATVKMKQEETAKELRKQVTAECDPQIGLSAERIFRQYTKEFLTTLGHFLDFDIDRLFSNHISKGDRFGSISRDLDTLRELEPSIAESVKTAIKEAIVETCDVRLDYVKPNDNHPLGNQYYDQALALIGLYEDSSQLYDNPWENNPYNLGFRAAYKELYSNNPNDPRLDLIKEDGLALSKSMPFEEIEAEARQEAKHEERRESSFAYQGNMGNGAEQVQQVQQGMQKTHNLPSHKDIKR